MRTVIQRVFETTKKERGVQMSKDFIPSICGDENIHIPTQGCDDCDRLEARVKDLEDTRLVQSDILEGENVTVDYADDSNEVTINVDLSNYYDKSEIDTMLSNIGAYEEVAELPTVGDKTKIYLVPIQGGGYERWIYTDDGWKDIGSTQITIDKPTILNALGYKETTIRMTATDGTTAAENILVKI